ncbi:phosphatase PAP2 family protein [SAR202 cluster bacterium AD-804-J14_MRT_500m]|nr:phosphatase PAP2 family protein [SAR202 cluster bacterium AD-804-J14_MRT_500m]
MKNFDTQIIIELNRLIGNNQNFDKVLGILASDYLIPAVMALSLVAFWFSGHSSSDRFPRQWSILSAVLALGLANLIVLLSNDLYFRPRPFIENELTLILYMPTDSSFPANPAVLSFALASSLWRNHKRISLTLMITASVWCFSRVVGGVFYISDVLAGAIIGMAIALLAMYILRWLEPIPSLLIRTARLLHLA